MNEEYKENARSLDKVIRGSHMGSRAVTLLREQLRPDCRFFDYGKNKGG